MRTFLLFLGLLMFQFGHAQTGDWNTYETDSFAISYPGSWTVDESGQIGTKLILMSTVESAKDKFAENVNIILQNMTDSKLSLDGYVRLTEESIPVYLNKAKIISSERLEGDSGEFHKLVYSSKQKKLKVYFIQYIYYVGDTVYIATFSTVKKEYEEQKVLGEEILNSFKIVK
ncbi:MAG: hypothetical protein MK078_17355 [Crocinitomicaceae bacterium]|nr:hypothetical protein [Crocinitomicaceae bacterium]